jgi:hypothetical protein
VPAGAARPYRDAGSPTVAARRVIASRIRAALR